MDTGKHTNSFKTTETSYLYGGPMRILVALECSGMTRDALIAKGHDAWSCDLKPTERPGPHYQCDIREVLYEPWDMMIAHPVCKYLANSGNRWLYEKSGRMELVEQAANFFKLFDRAEHIPLRAVENPIMRHAIERVGRKADQYVHPHFFGSPFQKATGLWLHGLPKLVRTHWPKDYQVEIKQAVWKMPPGPNRETDRSRTDPAIAKAFADQWGNL